ncbi:MAG: hypothetical protein ABIZ05_03520 [Pseudonocardiaceae bacterium]
MDPAGWRLTLREDDGTTLGEAIIGQPIDGIIPYGRPRPTAGGDMSGGEARDTEKLIRAIAGQQEPHTEPGGDFSRRGVHLGQGIKPGPDRRPNRLGSLTVQIDHHQFSIQIEVDQ